MQLIMQEDYWSCCLCSWAMVLGTTKDNIINTLPKTQKNKVAHNLMYGTLKSQHVEGFYTHDLMPVIKKHGYNVMIINRGSTSYDSFLSTIKGKTGILELNYACGGHAVAWDGERIYDPSRGIKFFSKHFFNATMAFHWAMPKKNKLGIYYMNENVRNWYTGYGDTKENI